MSLQNDSVKKDKIITTEIGIIRCKMEIYLDCQQSGVQSPFLVHLQLSFYNHDLKNCAAFSYKLCTNKFVLLQYVFLTRKIKGEIKKNIWIYRFYFDIWGC